MLSLFASREEGVAAVQAEAPRRHLSGIFYGKQKLSRVSSDGANLSPNALGVNTLTTLPAVVCQN